RAALRPPVGSRRDHRAQRVARDLAVVEGNDPPRRLLALLVPLAGDHDDVARTRGGDRARDRARAVDLHLGLADHAHQDLLETRLRLLAARVVRGDDREVAQLGRDPTHHRTLGAVAVAAAAEDADPPSARLR